MEIWPNEVCDKNVTLYDEYIEQVIIDLELMLRPWEAIKMNWHQITKRVTVGLRVREQLYVTVVPWTSSHILYGLPVHQKGDISKATC